MPSTPASHLAVLGIVFVIVCAIAWWLRDLYVADVWGATGDMLQGLGATLGAAAVLGGGWFTLRTWRADQHWKRLDALLARISSLDATPGTRNAMMIMMDSKREVPLWDHSLPEKRYTEVSWRDAENALAMQDGYPIHHNETASAIRDSFNDFLSRMAHIAILAEAEALKKNDVEYLFRPWIFRIYGRQTDAKAERLAQAIRDYIECLEQRGGYNPFASFMYLKADMPVQFFRPSMLLVWAIAQLFPERIRAANKTDSG